jgi:hypothetical protein
MAAMIGAPHGVKRPADLGDVSAEAFQHRTDNAVALYDDTVLFDLGWQMAIAQVPSQLAKVQAIARGDGIELFIRGDDLYLASVFQNQEIAMGQGDRLGKIQHDPHSASQGQDFPPQMPLVMRQNDRFGRGA